MPMPKSQHPQKRLYGRRQGRALRKTRAAAMAKKLDTLCVPEQLLTEIADLPLSKLFENPKHQTWMEIGFGNGAHLLALLERFDNINFLGAEPFINGMAAFLKDLPTAHEPRIRVLMDDALLLIKSLADETLDRLYILNPDPWPKTRHHKRRIVNPKNLEAFARVLKPGAQIVMATDVDDLAGWMVTHCSNHPAFEWTAEKAEDWQIPPPEWIETRFAFKGKQAGRRQTFLIFKKK
jgi:tRNA (guanine-N7-)-methyltransferase